MPCRTSDSLDSEVPDEILAKVENRLAGRRGELLDWLHGFDPSHRLSVAGDELGALGKRLEDFNCLPHLVASFSQRPPVNLFGRIVLLAVVDLGKSGRTFRDSPVLVGYDLLHASVIQRRFELRNNRVPVSPDVALPTLEANPAAEPAFGHADPDAVLARLEETRDIVGLVLQSVVVLCESRCEEIVANTGAVDLGFVDTLGSDVQAS